MDFDVLSQCSGISNPSEEIRSNLSSLSDLSTYQDEFAELRHLLDPLKYPLLTAERCSTPKPDSGSELPYNDRISSLSSQLEDSLKLNEKYKNDLYNLEKNIELKFSEKINSLLKSNHRLKLELDKANGQIYRLITNYSTKQDTSLVSHKNYIALEQKYHDISLQNSTLQFSSLECKNQNEELESQNKQLRIEQSELKIDFEAKKVCIKELKETISQQHLEIETLLKNNVLNTQLLKEVSSELEHLKKIQDWYKEQLHACQKDKKVLSWENLKCKTDLGAQKETIDKLNLELTKCRNKCDVMKIEFLKEKESLQKLPDKQWIDGQAESKSSSSYCEIIKKDDKSIINYYEASIQDLTDELMKIKEYLQEQDAANKTIVKENSELTAHCIVLQKINQQNELTIEELENCKKQLDMEFKLANDAIKERNEELYSLKTELLKANAELKVRLQEKEIIDRTIKTVRDQFFAFKSKYKQIEDELLLKNKQILQLETEKQKMFMKNNWNICELEKNKEKDAVIINLKNMISKHEETIIENMGVIKRLQNELQEKDDTIKDLSESKQSILEKNLLEIRKYEEVLIQYRLMVDNFEKQVYDLQNELRERASEVTNLKDDRKLLKEELHKKDLKMDVLFTKCTTLENKLVDYERNKSVIPSEDFELNMKKLVSKYGFNVTDVIQHFMKVYKFNKNENDDYKLKAIEHFLNTLKTLETHSLELHHCNNNEQNTEIQAIIKLDACRLENEVNTKLSYMRDKTITMSDKLEKCCKMINTLTSFKKAQNVLGDESKLNVLLQVKEREIKEKQRKYEKNYRTLLRKVKEHMKGRNSAEKHNKYLQELYNTLSEEHNSLKLESSSRDFEIDSIKKQLENYTSLNKKLNQTVLSLEKKLVDSEICEKCLHYTAVINKCEMLEKLMKELNDEKRYVQDILKRKEEVIVDLHQEQLEMRIKNSNLAKENDKLKNKLDNTQCEKENFTIRLNELEKELDIKQNIIEELRYNVAQENKQNLESKNEIIALKTHINELDDKMRFMIKDIEILNSALQSKSEEISQLEDRNSKMECNWAKKDEHSHKTISALKNYLHEMQAELNAVISDKYFLQRLCSDLKLALKTYVSHNKGLKEQVKVLSAEKQGFNSLPNFLPDIPINSECDDTYINRLLEQNKAPAEDKPLVEIKGCLENLRKEISGLQHEIVKKNAGI